MQDHVESIKPLISSIKVDRFHVSCRFKCDVKNRTVVSIVPFEPYDGRIELTWKDILFHPIKSYNRYYHTPIRIYGSDFHETIVLKAFEKVSNHFQWNYQLNRYVYE